MRPRRRSKISILAGLALAGLASLPLTASPAMAQVVAKMTGIVIDDQGNPLKGAAVYVKDVATNNVPRPAKTSAKGRFTYTSLPPATYILWAEFEGYMMARLVVTITGGDGTEHVMTWFYDDKQEFDDPVRVFPTGGFGSLVKNEFEFLMTTPSSHTAVVNRLYAEYSGTDEEGEGEEAEAAPAEPVEKTAYEKGMDFVTKGNSAAAVPYLTQAVSELEAVEGATEELVEAQYQLGKAALEAGSPDVAEAALGKARELDPTKPGVSFHLARVYNDKGMKQEALQALEQELELSPDSEVVLQNLAALYNDLGQTDLAVQTYESLIEANPEGFEPYAALAAIYKAAGDREKEAEIYRRMGDVDPTGQALYNLGNLAFNDDNREKAKFYYERVIDKNPKHAMAHYQLANTLLGMGDLAGAVEHFEQFAKLSPKDPKAAEALSTAKALKEML